MSIKTTIRNNLNKLLTRESIRSTVGTAAKKAKSYTKLFNRNNEEHIDYKTGLSILRDLQVATGFDILKYLLSSIFSFEYSIINPFL